MLKFGGGHIVLGGFTAATKKLKKSANPDKYSAAAKTSMPA